MIINFFEIEDWEKSYLEPALIGHTLSFVQQPLADNNVGAYLDTEILSPFIYSSLNKNLLAKLPNLRLISTRSAGFDHIDLEYCQKHKITVCNVPAYGVNTIAEHTFALILALSRKIIPSVMKTKRGDFTLDNLRGFELAGKTLGIIGLGHIGKKVAEIASGFKMNILVNTSHPDYEFKAKYAVNYCDLETLLKESHIVTLHLPLTLATKHLINQKNIQLMAKGSVLINTSRGAIVETEAILYGLEKGILRGAGLDVLEEEGFLKEERQLLTREFLLTCDLKTQLLNHVLLTKDNVIITPHNAFNSTEALEEILKTTLNNIKGYFDHKIINMV